MKICILLNSYTPPLYRHCLKHLLYCATIHGEKECDFTLHPFEVVCDVNYPIRQCNLDVRWCNIVFAHNKCN